MENGEKTVENLISDSKTRIQGAFLMLGDAINKARADHQSRAFVDHLMNAHDSLDDAIASLENLQDSL